MTVTDLLDRIIDLRNRDYYRRTAMEQARAAGLRTADWLDEFRAIEQRLRNANSQTQGETDA